MVLLCVNQRRLIFLRRMLNNVFNVSKIEMYFNKFLNLIYEKQFELFRGENRLLIM